MGEEKFWKIYISTFVVVFLTNGTGRQKVRRKFEKKKKGFQLWITWRVINSSNFSSREKEIELISLVKSHFKKCKRLKFVRPQICLHLADEFRLPKDQHDCGISANQPVESPRFTMDAWFASIHPHGPTLQAILRDLHRFPLLCNVYGAGLRVCTYIYVHILLLYM